MTDASTLRAVLSDAELILATRSGDGDAYGELYIRHLQSARAAAHALTRSKSDADDVVAEAFSRVLGVLQRGGGPEVSFRPYLLTTVRNTFYERGRRTRLEDTTDQPDDVVNLSLLDMAASEDDRAIIASAFASLPERWQLVLWHTEVEGRSAAEVAPLLGIAPNAVAARSYRAREGLRQAYLQSHLLTPMTDACQECVSNLGAYVRDSLAARDRRKVDDHLATCATCPALLAELTDANTKLRAVLVPLIIGVPAAKYLAGLGAGKGLVAVIRRLPRFQQAGLGSVAASMVAGVVVAAATLAGPSDSRRVEPADASVVVVQTDASSSGGSADSVESGAAIGTGELDAPSTSRETVPDSVPDTTEDTLFDDESTPSNTLPEDVTQDSSDIIDLSPDDQVYVPVIPSAPNITVRTTPTTQPRSTTPTTRYVLPTAPVTQGTQGTTAPTQGTTAPTQGTTAPTQATTPPTQATTPPTQATTPPTQATTPPTQATTPPTPAPTTTTAPPPPLAAPQIGAEVLGRAYTGGQALIRINIANGATPGGGNSFRSVRAAGPATAIQVSIPVPAGVTFASVDDPAWTCSTPAGATTIVCDVPGLADAARDSAMVRFDIGPAVGNFLLRPSVSADGGAPVEAGSPLPIQVSTIDRSIAAVYDTGSVLIVGNTSMTCQPLRTGTACVDARNGIGPVTDQSPLNRQTQTMINVDTQVAPDADGRDPFNSSTATLTLGGPGVTTTKAYLVWGGDTVSDNALAAVDSTRKNTVRLTGPDGVFHDIVSTNVETWTADNSIYSAYADVTAFVQTSGVYRVSDVQAAQGLGSLGGWSLVVVTHDPAAPMRVLAVTAPGHLVNNGNAAYTTNIPLDRYTGTGARPVTVAIASFEGERALLGDRLLIGTDAPRLNPFDATVVGALDPAHVNNYGTGSNIWTTTVNGTALPINASSTQDQVRLALIAISADV